MASKKVYAVKKGKITGVFDNWPDCKESVDGYAGAQYKGFSDIAEAYAYLGITPPDNMQKKIYSKKIESKTMKELPAEGCLLAYVDGSYEDSIKKYAFGCVFLLPDGRIYTQNGNGDNEKSLQQRNVTGEMLGSMYAVKTAMWNGYSKIEIRYDYEGIEKWVTGEWKAKTELTQKYAQAMKEWSKQIDICFTKVMAHSNVKYNELADETAKAGLLNGTGIPKICRLEEMKEYSGS